MGNKSTLERSVRNSPRGHFVQGLRTGPAQMTQIILDQHRRMACRRSGVGPDPYNMTTGRQWPNASANNIWSPRTSHSSFLPVEAGQTRTPHVTGRTHTVAFDKCTGALRRTARSRARACTCQQLGGSHCVRVHLHGGSWALSHPNRWHPPPSQITSRAATSGTTLPSRFDPSWRRRCRRLPTALRCSRSPIATTHTHACDQRHIPRRIPCLAALRCPRVAQAGVLAARDRRTPSISSGAPPPSRVQRSVRGALRDPPRLHGRRMAAAWLSNRLGHRHTRTPRTYAAHGTSGPTRVRWRRRQRLLETSTRSTLKSPRGTIDLGFWKL